MSTIQCHIPYPFRLANSPEKFRHIAIKQNIAKNEDIIFNIHNQTLHLRTLIYDSGNTQIQDSQETKLIFKEPQFKKLCYQPQHSLTIKQKLKSRFCYLPSYPC